MGAEIQGVEIRGIEYRTERTFLYYPTQLWLDYEKLATPKNYSGVDRLETIVDNSPNAYFFSVNTPSLTTARPLYSTVEGIQWQNIGSTNGHQSNPTQRLRFWHNGSGWILMGVCKLTDVASADNLWSIVRTAIANTQIGVNISISASLRRFQIAVVNGSGANFVLINSTTNQIPVNEWFFFSIVFYGSGTGSNNLRITINNTVYLHTVSATAFSNDNPSVLHYFRRSTGMLGHLHNKNVILTDCTGKTITEINDIHTDLIKILKADSRYASLTTP